MNCKNYNSLEASIYSVCYTAKLEPQPHFAVAFGFLMVKDEDIKPSS